MSGLSEEQRLLKDSVEKFVAGQYEFAVRRKILTTESGFLPEHWTQFAELGWLGAPFSEADGGLGGTSTDVAIIADVLGKGLYVGPFISGVITAGGLVANAGNADQKERWLVPLIAGKQLLAFAYAEPQSRYDLANVATTATVNGTGFQLSGHKSVVLFAAQADHLIVSARTSGSQSDHGGITLFVVPGDAPGLRLRPYVTVDGYRAAEVHLDEVMVDANCVLGPTGEAYPAIERVADLASLALCAEAVGCMQVLYENTLEYLKQREQFGVKLGSFQALQHRMVDVYMSYEESRSITYATAVSMDDATDQEFARLVSVTKAHVGKAGRHVGQEAVQLHGGMGMTDELSIGHYFKRLTTINTMFGDVAHHLRRFRQLDKAG